MGRDEEREHPRDRAADAAGLAWWEYDVETGAFDAVADGDTA
ncbi:hypothetical protein [Halorubellus sp. PRR65]|nr:hypothetical protein [Halorubellus sp. PRR65]